jgi:hypothetical protein
MALSKGSKQKKPKKKTGKSANSWANRSAKSILMDKMRRSEKFENSIILDSHSDVEKMSGVLLEYAEPLTKPLPVHEDGAFRKSIGIAIMCWNAALSSKRRREEALNQFVSKTARDDTLPAAELLVILNFMVDRKHQLFGDNKRWILNYQVKSTKKEREILVVSTLEPNQVKSLLPAEDKPWWKRLLFWLN